MTLNTQVTKAQVFEGTVWVQEKLSERFHQVDHLLLTNKLCTQVYNMYNTIYKQHTYIQHEGNTNIWMRILNLQSGSVPSMRQHIYLMS